MYSQVETGKFPLTNLKEIQYQSQKTEPLYAKSISNHSPLHSGECPLAYFSQSESNALETNLEPVLVIELFGVLLDCSIFPEEEYDTSLEYQEEGLQYHFYLKFHPGAFEFLQSVAAKFRLVLFTRATRAFLSAFLALFGELQVLFSDFYFQEDCTLVGGQYLKDLQRIGIPLSRIILLDSMQPAQRHQWDNCINFVNWFQDDEQRELYYLLYFLQNIEAGDSIPKYTSGLRTAFLQCNSQ